MGSFYESYIENNRELDGAIRWLPMCAEVDGYIANLDLFDEYDIPVPENYEKFAEACRRFEENGITPFLEGKVAIMRGTANDCVLANQQNGMNCVMLPYFGETDEDNWLLTYPIYQAAVNKRVEQDSSKNEAVMKVLEAMFSEEGQRLMASGAAVLSYNKNVNIEISDSLEMVKDCVERNHLYMRLASTEMFSISQAVAQKMIRGEYGPTVHIHLKI